MRAAFIDIDGVRTRYLFEDDADDTSFSSTASG